MCHDMTRYVKLNDNTAEIQVETFCSKKQRQVILTLLCSPIPKGKIVKGKPIFCNYQNACSKEPPEKCYLNAESIETKRL